jgi:tripartite-type tricarboxylate transporter receptor subunit TctC
MTRAQFSYRGTPQATTDLLGGQIDFVVMDASQTRNRLHDGGGLRRLREAGTEALGGHRRHDRPAEAATRHTFA